ncbi:MAG: BamA/TamA family outer membrane protein, partial [Planctomycetes bacterium]|nr:BamA/TamA family outer membrane protein [Planctomycetota bacterium]
IQLGSDFGMDAELYLPLDDRLRWILKPEVFASRREFQAYNDNGHSVAELQVDELGGKLSFGREFRRHAGVFAALTRYRGSLDVKIGFPAQNPYDFNGGDVSVLALYDRLDDYFMPSSGAYASLEYLRSLDSLGADQEFEQIRSELFAVRSWGRHTVWLESVFNTTLDNDAPIYALYTGGGFLYMSGYESDELIGQHFGFSLLGYRYRMSQTGLLPAYVGTTVEYGNAGELRGDVYGNGVLNGSIYMGYNSPVGPLYVGYGWNEEQSGVYFLRLGTILGKRSLGRR